MRFPELQALKIEVHPDTRRRHLDTISRAIRSNRAPRVRRLRLLAVAAALVLLLPVVALAAKDAVPGDFLYPIKRLTEPIVAAFDQDVAAQNRVAELESLLDANADVDMIREHADTARRTVGDDPILTDRIDRVVEDLVEPGRNRDPDAAERVVPTTAVTDDPTSDTRVETDSTIQQRLTTTTVEETKRASERHSDR
jgi:hypothetical protein